MVVGFESMDGVRSSVPPVVSLFEAGSPSTVLGLVVAVRIDAVDAGPLRPGTHVCEEDFE
jgi:hypothetical protein